MTATFITDEITPVSLPELAEALAAGHRRVLGSDFVSAASMASAFAQLCLESGNGQKAHLWNFHNEKLGSDWGGLYTSFRCDEIFDEQTAARAGMLGPCSVSPWKGGPLCRVVLFAEHPWARFVAFTTAEQGAARYVEFLSCRARYTQAWYALRHGTATDFSHALRAAGYYTADESAYTAGLVSIARRSLPLCESALDGADGALTDDDLAHISGLVALTAAETLWHHDRHEEMAA